MKPLYAGEFEVPSALKSKRKAGFGTSFLRTKVLPLLRFANADLELETYEGRQYVKLTTWQPGESTVQYMSFATLYLFTKTWAELAVTGQIGRRGWGFGMAAGKEGDFEPLFFIPWWVERALRNKFARFLEAHESQVLTAAASVSSLMAAEQAMEVAKQQDKATIN